MRISRIDKHGVPVLCCHGHLGNISWPDFLAELKSTASLRPPRMAIDLSGVTRMGHSQALLLFDLRNQLARRGQILSIVGLSPAAIEAMSYASRLRRRSRF